MKHNKEENMDQGTERPVFVEERSMRAGFTWQPGSIFSMLSAEY
jgi:hypothetical protein